MKLEHLLRLLEKFGAVQVLGREDAQKLRMLDEVVPGERDELFDGLDRLQVCELQLGFGRADADIGALKNGEIQTVLVAEVVIDHPLVGAGFLGDRVDARAGIAFLGELGDGGGEDRRAGALGVAGARAAYTRRLGLGP